MAILMRFGGEHEFYAVWGLTDPLYTTLGRPRLPYVVETVLLPFKGKIIYDSFMATFNFDLGESFAGLFEKKYDEVKAAAGIIESLSGRSAKERRFGQKDDQC